MNKHFIGLGIAVKVNYYKVFGSSVFGTNFYCYLVYNSVILLQFLPVKLSVLLDS